MKEIVLTEGVYLIESVLGKYLELIFPNHKFINNKTLPGCGKAYRPDYRNDELKLIVEFDGFLHYTSNKMVLGDIEKKKFFENLGYRYIQIPYFVQLTSKIIKLLFGVSTSIDQYYPQGFVDKNVILPSDFCERGIERFITDLEKYSFIKKDIINSLKDKIKLSKGIEYVLPPSLNNLV